MHNRAEVLAEADNGVDDANNPGSVDRGQQTPGEWRWWLSVVVGLTGFLAVAIGLMRAIGMEELGDTIGALLTTAGVFVGLVLKRQSDQRLALESRQTEDRLNQEHRDEQERLRLDAAMRAATLFNSSDDAPVDPASIASGLLALAELDRVGLAVALLVDLWPEPVARDTVTRLEAHTERSQRSPSDTPTHVLGQPVDTPPSCVSTETAILVIDAALSSDDANAHLIAAELLCRHAADLNPCASLHWPSSVNGRWNADFAPRTKVLLVDALVHMAVNSPPTESALSTTAARLYCAWDKEPDDSHPRRCIGLLLNGMQAAIERMPYEYLLHGTLRIPKAKIDEAAGTCDTATEAEDIMHKLAIDLRRKLESWASQCHEPYRQETALLAAI